MVAGTVGWLRERSSSTRRERAPSASFDREREARVRLRVLVAAVDTRLGRQCPELRERVPHLLRRPLEESAAAQREQRVAAEERARSAETEGDMAARVAWHVEDARHPLAEGVVLTVGDVDAGDARAVGAGPHDGAASLLLEREIAAGVVGMVVRVEDVREAPAGLHERHKHGTGLRGIDRAAGGGLGIAQQVDVIVPQRLQLADLELSHALAPHPRSGIPRGDRA